MTTTENLNITNMLNSVAERGATDIHFTVGSPAYVRVNGILSLAEGAEVITPVIMDSLVNFFVKEDKRKLLAEGQELKFVFDWAGKGRLRVHIFRQKGYHSLSLKLIPPQVKTISELGLPKVIESFAKAKQGLIFISGPYNSGRSATMAAILETINTQRSERIVYLEDPVEQLFINQKSVVEQREVGTDILSLTDGLQSLKDEDVNVVAVSRVDCLETMEILLELAVSGKLVLAAMDYDTSISCLAGIISDFPQAKKEWVSDVLADYLVGLVVQRLVPGIDGFLVLAAEVLTATSSSKALIAEGRYNQLESIIQTSREEGMMSLDYSLGNLLKLGRISQETAAKYAVNKRNT